MITILQSALPLCKRFVGGVGQPYPNARYFQAHERNVTGLDDLHALIAKLNDWRHGFVIRGELIGSDGSRVERRSRGDSATFKDPVNGNQWACIDVDTLPYWGTPESLESVSHCIREALPVAFHGSSCVYQWSASAGVDGWKLFKLHLWFWFDRPVNNGALRDWLATYPVDLSLFRTVQPHYTSAPIFEDCEDPVRGSRVGLIEGRESVAVPWTVPTPAHWREAEQARLTDLAVQQREAREAYIRMGTARVKGRREAVARGILRKACKFIVEAHEGQRHTVIYREAAGVGNFVGSGLINGAHAVSVLSEAALSTLPDNRHAHAIGTISDAIQEGMTTPRSIPGV